WFRRSEFGQDAVFDFAEFGSTVRFHNAQPRRTVRFHHAWFHEETWSNRLNFPADASFDGAVFGEPPRSATIQPPSTEGVLNLLSVTPRRVFLVGLMGSGKTTIGTELAELIGWEYLDNDILLKELTGFDAPALVRKVGVEGLRDAESRHLHNLLPRPAPFIAGVAPSVGDRRHDLRAMADAGYIIYLKTRPETLAKRVGAGEGRPLLRAEEDPLKFFQKQTNLRDTNYRTAGGSGAVDYI